MTDRRLHNTFAALALHVADGIRLGAREALDHGGETAAALTLIGHVDGLTIDEVATGLGLSHPGTVRVVDRLVEAGYAERRPSPSDRRAVALHLTADGRRMRRTILAGRRDVTADLLGRLSALQREQLDGIVATLLAGVIHGVADAYATCRLCDEKACRPCPVEAALERAVPARGD